MVTELCECGSCRAAYDRALKICEQMYGDNECPIFQMGVARSMCMIALYGLSKLIVYRTEGEGLGLGIVELLVSAAYNKNAIDQVVDDFLNSMGREGPKEVDPWFDRMMTRVKEDFEATQKDEPNIGKPKG